LFISSKIKGLSKNKLSKTDCIFYIIVNPIIALKIFLYALWSRFRLAKIQLKLKRIRFTKSFPSLEYNEAIIFGNGSSINKISKDKIKKFKNAYKLGLNNFYLSNKISVDAYGFECASFNRYKKYKKSYDELNQFRFNNIERIIKKQNNQTFFLDISCLLGLYRSEVSFNYSIIYTPIISIPFLCDDTIIAVKKNLYIYLCLSNLGLISKYVMMGNNSLTRYMCLFIRKKIPLINLMGIDLKGPYFWEAYPEIQKIINNNTDLKLLLKSKDIHTTNNLKYNTLISSKLIEVYKSCASHFGTKIVRKKIEN